MIKNGGSRTLYTTLMSKKNLLALKFSVQHIGEAENSSCTEPIALIENDVVDQTPVNTRGQNALDFGGCCCKIIRFKNMFV